MNQLIASVIGLNKQANRAISSVLDEDFPSPHLDPGDVDRNGNRDEEFEKLDKLADQLNRENIVYINGVAYGLESWGDANEDGSRSATLRIWRPF